MKKIGKEATRIVDNLINPPLPVQQPQLPKINKQQQSIPPEFQSSFISDQKLTSSNFINNQTTMVVSEQISQLKIDNNFNPTNNLYSTSSTFYQQQTWKQGVESINNNNSSNNSAKNQQINSFNSSLFNDSPHKYQHHHSQQTANNMVRESLDDRLEHLFLNKKAFGNSFFGELSGLSNLSSPSFESTSKHNQRNSDYYNRINKETISHSSFHSEQILGTPPSPFLSYSDFIKWTKVTKAIDEGRDPSISGDEDQINDFNHSDDNLYDDQDTPKRRSFTRSKYKSHQQFNKNHKNNNPKYEMDELDDDCMSLSSLSSGEKLELPNDSERLVSFSRKGFVPFTINSNDSVLKRNKYNWKSNSIDTVNINNNNQSFKFQISTTSSNLNNSSFFDSTKRPNQLSKNNKFNDVFDSYDDYNNRQIEDESKMKRSRLQNIKQGVIKIVVAELRGIIQKDINKKMIESTAFQIYENWWDDNEKQFKLKKEQKENQENLNSTDKLTIATITNKPPAVLKEADPIALSSVLSAVSYNKSNSNPFSLSEGYQFGHLRAAIPKMPSFKRKVKQTRNEDGHHYKNDYKKTMAGTLSDEEFEKISSDDGEVFSTEKKYVKNRSAAIIDNDLMDSLSDDSDHSSLSISSSKQRKRKHQHSKKIRSSLSPASNTTSSFSSSSSSNESSSGSSSEESDESQSGDESDSSRASSISTSSLESFDRNKQTKTSKKIKSSVSTSSRKSSLLSSISESSISSKSLSSLDDASRSSLSGVESGIEEGELEEFSKSSSTKKQKESEIEVKHKKQQQLKIEQTKQLEINLTKIDSPKSVEKPVKRKVGRPPKANKQQKQNNKEENSTTISKFNEKENVKPLHEQYELDADNDLMTREEIEASEALMALSGFFSGTQTANKQTDQTASLPKPVIILSNKQKLTNDKQSSTYEMCPDVETDSASEAEEMKAIFETPEESVAIDHAYCIPTQRPIHKSKYDDGNYDFSTVFKEDQMLQSDHLYSKISPNDLYGKVKNKKRQLQTTASIGKKGRKSKASKENDENVEMSLIIEKPKIKFTERTKELEQEILYDFIQNGIDSEDVKYLKRSYDTLLQEDANYAWLNESHWSDHPPTKIPPLKKKKKEELRVHMTGCARTEGYYKMTDKEKAKSSYVVNATQEADEENENEDSTKVLRTRMPTTQQATREARSNQRRLLATVDVAWSDLLKFNQLQFRKKQLKFARSKIHDWGLFALEPIAADEMVIEYVGQMIRPVVADLREKKYNEMGIGSSYLFRVDLETIIDATKVGNLARFINHSCTVSCKTA